MREKKDGFDWNVFPDNVEEVLGEQFWGDLQRMIPKRGPSVDVYQTDSEGVVLVEVPGLKSVKDIQLKQNGSQLIIQGSVPYTYPIPKDKLIKSERFIGVFSRTISLPFSYSTDQITARYKNGILEIHVPKSKQERSIEIEMME
ncbi:MAG: Hsp20/alpha crystallin family protein [Bacillaceae bacterium]